MFLSGSLALLASGDPVQGGIEANQLWTFHSPSKTNCLLAITTDPEAYAETNDQHTHTENFFWRPPLTPQSTAKKR